MKRLSSRPKKLTEAQEIELRAWYYSARSVAQKARELGISRTALYWYVNRKHKPRKEETEQTAKKQSDKFHGEHETVDNRTEARGAEC